MNSEMAPRPFRSALAAIGITIALATTVADAAPGQVTWDGSICWRDATYGTSTTKFQPPIRITARNFFAAYMEQEQVAWRFDLYWAATQEIAILEATSALMDPALYPSGSDYQSRWYYNRVNENGRPSYQGLNGPDWYEFPNYLGRYSWVTTSEEKSVSLNWSGYWYTVATVYWYPRAGRAGEHTRMITGVCVK